jgi:esterase/lipase superfamily enzyme
MRSVPAVMRMLSFLDRWRNPQQCQVNFSVIAHSMGNLVLREGLFGFAKRLGFPEFMPYLTEVLMVAADVDSDSLVAGGTGRGITSLSRRVTVYYSRHDNTLSVSRFGKHWGEARLGRNGPNAWALLPRNVVGVDCTDVVAPVAHDVLNRTLEELFAVHSAYWDNDQWESDAAQTLRSVDRAVIDTREPVPELSESAFRLKKP